jgi:hemerythrin
MPLLEWNDKMLLGIRQFDEHHKHLVLLLNMTFDGITSDAPKDELEAVLDELQSYAAYHFAAEEEWMKSHGYPDLEQHLQEHAFFTGKIAECHADYHRGHSGLDMEILNFLTDWLVNHIMIRDTDYGSYVAAKGLPGGVDLSVA